MDLTTATPRQIDEKLAELYQAVGRVEKRLTGTLIHIRKVVGQKPIRSTRATVSWTTSVEQTIEDARERSAEYLLTHRCTIGDLVAQYDALVAELASIEAEMAPLNAEHTRRPWSRFFLVTSSDGHIHSSMHCSTCRPTTAYGWLPQLSGKTEADAVADQGPLLCTVCFPSAPVAWTVGKPKPTYCAGGSPTDRKRVGMNTYGTCPACGERVIVTMSGKGRKHKPKN